MKDIKHTGVLLVAHGTITDLDELPQFLARIRRGRAAPPELLTELRRRYEAIGGSPLLEMTQRQADKLAARLECSVSIGMRFSEPSISAALIWAETQRIRQLVVLPLAPFSVEIYANVVAQIAEGLLKEGHAVPALIPVSPWGSHPQLVEAHAEWIRSHLGDKQRDFPLVLTAHSLPTAAISAGDHYADEVEAAAIAIGLRLQQKVHLAYQSQGADGGDWLGPTLAAKLEELARGGAEKVVIAPVGFLSDHVETLFDLDIEAKADAARMGIEMLRIPALNAADSFVAALTTVVEEALAAAVLEI